MGVYDTAFTMYIKYKYPFYENKFFYDDNAIIISKMQKYPNMEIRMTNNPLHLFFNHFSFKFQLFLWEFAVLYLVAQSCSTFCDPLDGSLPDSSVHWNSPD